MQCLSKEMMASERRRIDCRTFLMITGLNTFNCKLAIQHLYLKMAIGSSNCDGRMVSHHLGTNHCHGLALSWIYLKSLHKNATFPGMIEEPGSFSGNDISPRPDLGPLPSKRISFAIFINDTASVFRIPETSTRVS